MADQIVTNEIPGNSSQLFAIVRLVETMVAAGYTLVENSDGTTVSTVTNYWTQANYASLGDFAWIVLDGGAAVGHICFRNSNSTSVPNDGWIVWSKGGGFTTGGSATAPASVPADAGFVRGTGAPGTPGSFSTDASWLGSGNAYDRLNIGVRDAAADGSFWVVAKKVATTYADGTNGSHGLLAFDKLAHPAGLGIVDATPYAWLAPDSPTSVWTSNLNDARILMVEDNASGAAGRWRRWYNAGQAGEAFVQYGAGQIFNIDGSSLDTGESPPWAENAGDQAIYQATPQQLIRRIHLANVFDTTHRDSEGGWTTNIFFTNDNDVPSLSTLAAGAYAKFGGWLTVWWDGNAANPPVE